MQKEFWKQFIRSPEFDGKNQSNSSQQDSQKVKMLQKVSHRLTFDKEKETNTVSLRNPQIQKQNQKLQTSLDQVAITNSGKKKVSLQIPFKLETKHSQTLLRSSKKQSSSFLRYSKGKSTKELKPLSSIKYSQMGKWLQKQKKQNIGNLSNIMTQQIEPKINNEVLYEMVLTLREVRDIEKQNLKTNQKILEHMQQNRSSISRKSHKKQSLTTTKKIKIIEQKMMKFNAKIHQCVKMKHDLQMYVRENKNNLTKQKYLSAYK